MHLRPAPAPSLRAGHRRAVPPARERRAVSGRQRQRRRRRRRRAAAPRACSSGAGPRPSASPSVRRITWWMYDWSRNRTSAFVGCTLTSTRVVRHLDEQVHFRAALLDRRHAVGVDDRVRDRPVLDDAAVDEHVLRPARRPLLGQRRDVAEHLHVAAVAPHLDRDRRARRRAGTADRAASPPAGTAAPCARRSSA